MAELQVKTGKIKLDIIRDGEKVGVFTFNPSNLEESKKHAEIVKKLEESQDVQLAKAKDVDDNGSELERINFMKDIICDMRNIIDDVYGKGTSEMLFGDCYSAETINDFFVQLRSYYEKASKERKTKYKNNK